MSFENLSPGQLLGLIAVNFAALIRGGDARWRSGWKSFPVSGVSDEDVEFLADAGLAEMTPVGVIVTEKGRALLQGSAVSGKFLAIPAMRGANEAHGSLQ